MATELATGELLLGRYAVQRELGRGATGRVVLALDTAAGNAPRAIKLVGGEHVGRLRWEFALLGGIAHPNLARVYELLRLDRPVPALDALEGGAALVSELAPGLPASRVAAELQRDPEALLALVLTVADGAARALAALHGGGLVHGDLKPDNIVVAEDRRSCKLVDLGLGGEVLAGTMPGGTPGYMAPELFRGERGPAADCYALGVALQRLLRGMPAADERSRRPAEHLAEALRAADAREPLPSWTPPALQRLIESLIEPDPDARLARAGEVVARVALISHERGLAVEPVAGGGADDAPSPVERAAALAALPLVGHAAELDALVAAMSDALPCVVSGAPGSGRTRLVREAVRRLQSARLAAGRPAPSYREVERLPQGALGFDTVLHVTRGDALSVEQVKALLRAAAVEGRALSLVIERGTPLGGALGLEIALGPLAEGEVRRLLEHALPGVRASGALVREALAASGGLAGRLCRLLAHGLSAGIDVGRGPSLRALGGDGDAVPAELPAAARDLAELACVAGGELEHGAAEAAFSSAQALGEAYRTLIAAGLAVRSGSRLVLRDDFAAALRGALTREQVLALAERLPARGLDGRALAHLWMARGQLERAAAAFGDELARLRAAGRPEEAEQCAHEALTVVTAPAAAVERLRLLLADALRAQGRYADALASLAQAESVRALSVRAELQRLAGARAEAHALATRAAASAQTGAVDAEAILARLAFDEGDLERAERLARVALERAGSESTALRACEVEALVLLARGLRDDASAAIRSALERARKAGLRDAEARLLSLSGEAAREAGDPHGAARRFAAAFELADAAGDYHAAAAFLHNVGVQRLDCGEPGPAVLALRESARRLSRLGRAADSARALYNLGHAAQVVGADDVALASAQRARESAAEGGDATTHAYASCLEAEVRLRFGERKAALALLPDAGAEGQLAPPAAAMVVARSAALRLAAGDQGEADRELARAEALAREANSPAAEVECALARCQLSLARGEVEAARAAAELAHARAQQDGSFDARMRALLLSAKAARAAGDAGLAASRLADVRSLLDQAARGLSPAERARLRAVDAYRPAFEAVPSGQSEGSAGGGSSGGIAPALRGGAMSVDERWRALAGTAKRLTAERRLPRLYEIILDAAIELSGAERGYLVIKDIDGVPRVRAGRGLSQEDIDRGELALSRSIVARVLGSGRALATMDAAADERLSGAASVHALSLRSVVAVPLRVRGEIAGALYLEDRLRPFAFGELELSLLSDLADLAAIALDSAQLLRGQRRAARRLSVLRARLARRVEVQALELESLRRSQREGASEHAGIVGHSRGMQRVLSLVAKVARSEVPILICGESGTGKELIARAIHDAGPDKDAPFVSENCGAIPEPLLESALFGHVRGAFTGADRRRLGLFEVADGGTLFLDEIGEMSVAMQARLLRVLQDGEVRPVGSEQARRVRVRVLCATHRDLPAMVAEGRFREDLYYRLAVVTLALPALRERPEDIAPLIARFVEKYAHGRKVEIDRRALSALGRHPWPGNVRQLENEIRRALVLADDVIELEHLSPGLIELGAAASPDPLDMRAQVDQLERRLIRQALDASAGNQTRAARMLGISRYGLQKMLRRLDA
jgi:transcriptional regulator with GAF, ATPase, and Fis domain